MLAELCEKFQLIIPKEIVVKVGLTEDDKLDVFEKNGAIYPKKYLNELKEE